MKKRITGDMIIKKVDPLHVTMGMAEDKTNFIMSNKQMDFSREILPADYDIGVHSVDASFSITIEVAKKKETVAK